MCVPFCRTYFRHAGCGTEYQSWAELLLEFVREQRRLYAQLHSFNAAKDGHNDDDEAAPADIGEDLYTFAALSGGREREQEPGPAFSRTCCSLGYCGCPNLAHAAADFFSALKSRYGVAGGGAQHLYNALVELGFAAPSSRGVRVTLVSHTRGKEVECGPRLTLMRLAVALTTCTRTSAHV